MVSEPVPKSRTRTVAGSMSIVAFDLAAVRGRPAHERSAPVGSPAHPEESIAGQDDGRPGRIGEIDERRSRCVVVLVQDGGCVNLEPAARVEVPRVELEVGSKAKAVAGQVAQLPLVRIRFGDTDVEPVADRPHHDGAIGVGGGRAG